MILGFFCFDLVLMKLWDRHLKQQEITRRVGRLSLYRWKGGTFILRAIVNHWIKWLSLENTRYGRRALRNEYTIKDSNYKLTKASSINFCLVIQTKLFEQMTSVDKLGARSQEIHAYLLWIPIYDQIGGEQIWCILLCSSTTDGKEVSFPSKCMLLKWFTTFRIGCSLDNLALHKKTNLPCLVVYLGIATFHLTSQWGGFCSDPKEISFKVTMTTIVTTETIKFNQY